MFKLGYARLKKQIACDFLAGITSKAQGMLINVYSVWISPVSSVRRR